MILANSPDTLPETLGILSMDSDSVIRHLVALNPSTPPEALRELASDLLSQVRDGVLYNPNVTEEIILLSKGIAFILKNK
jgi:hypothetical protein